MLLVVVSARSCLAYADPELTQTRPTAASLSLCSLLNEERRRRPRPGEAAQPDLLVAKELIDCVGFAIPRQSVLVERDNPAR
jgi:hypothetical protein